MKNKIIITILVLMVIIGIGFKLNQRGTVLLNIPLKNTTVYIDDKKKAVTETENQVLEFKLSKKIHSIAVERAGYFPWQKDIKITGGILKVEPIFVTSNTTGVLITKNDKEYWGLRAKVTSQILPNEFNTKKLPNGDELWVEENTVLVRKNAEENGKVYVVIRPNTPIRSVDFYKEKSNNIIFASDLGVYLIDTKIEGIQNFFPLYKGNNPLFMSNATSSIYVLDGENLMLVVI